MPLRDLKKKVADLETSLLNIKIQGTAKRETWNETEKKWDYAGESDVTGYFTGAPGSKFRMDVHKQIIPWQNGAAPFTHNESSHAFNGRVAMNLQTATGDPAKPRMKPQGIIQAKRPEAQESATGWTMSLFGFFDDDAARFSERVFREGTEVSLNSAQGGTLLAVTHKSPNRQKTWYLDPDKGYALAGYEWLENNGTPVRRLEVREFVNAGGNVFYPVDASWHYFMGGKDFARVHYRASVVKANDPEFNENIFTLQFPRGTILIDKIANVTYEVGLADQELEQKLASQSFEAIQAAETAPARRASEDRVANPRDTPDVPQASTDLLRRPLVLYTTVGLLGLAILAIIVALRRQRSRRPA